MKPRDSAARFSSLPHRSNHFSETRQGSRLSSTSFKQSSGTALTDGPMSTLLSLWRNVVTTLKSSFSQNKVIYTLYVITHVLLLTVYMEGEFIALRLCKGYDVIEIINGRYA